MRLDAPAPAGSRVQARIELRPGGDACELFYLGQMGARHVAFVDLRDLTVRSPSASSVECRRTGDLIEIVAAFDLVTPHLFIGCAAADLETRFIGSGRIAFSLVSVEIQTATEPNPGRDSVVISSSFDADRPNVELTRLTIPVGACSDDGVVVFGRDDYLFVFNGSNRIADQYVMAEDEAAAIASRWVELIRRRAADCGARGITFVQVVVPEKSSLLPHLAPFPAAPGTPLLNALSEGLSDADYFIDVRRLFDDVGRRQAYPKPNGHMSPWGAYQMFASVSAYLQSPPACVAFTAPQPRRSDLADHFHGLQLYGYVALPMPGSLEAEAAELELVEFVDTARHGGSRRLWRNPSAPDPRRVLAFGNSFFECGNQPQHLSWWFSRWFREFQFVWSDRVDADIVAGYAPDVIICQTIERFLLQTPPT